MTRSHKDTATLSGRLPLILFIIALMFVAFGYGYLSASFEWPPYDTLQQAWFTAKGMIRSHTALANVAKARYDTSGVVVYEPDKVAPGITLITGSWNPPDGDWYHGIRLINAEGTLLHEWRINPRDVWPESPHDDISTGELIKKSNTMIHGAWLMPNGDVVFNFEYLTLVRMDKDGNVIWKLPVRTHHSVFLDKDGMFWVCGARWYERKVKEFPHLSPPFVEDLILQVSPDGTIVREISIPRVLFQSNHEGLIFTGSLNKGDDVVHLNNIDVLGRDLADRFELFDAGDIMVSMRDINTVMVIDGDTELIKWALTHPFVGQHDPDFTSDGMITVFNNGLSRPTATNRIAGSEILRVDPVTKEVESIYGHKKDQAFYTVVGGKHQHLSNGNILITETRGGRVFEVTPAGEVVWSWITSRWDAHSIGEIMQGMRLPKESLSFLN